MRGGQKKNPSDQDLHDGTINALCYPKIHLATP
jgi:hypothetical protein